MRIAYLIKQYPKVSHSFIRREIQALERQGVNVMRIGLRAGTMRWWMMTMYWNVNEHAMLCKTGLIVAFVRLLLTHRAKLLQALALSVKMPAARNVPRQFMLFMSLRPAKSCSGCGSSTSRICTPTLAPTPPK
jgi:colanic acid/amylovoran biosynthesis glycosyltransferase